MSHAPARGADGARDGGRTPGSSHTPGRGADRPRAGPPEAGGGTTPSPTGGRDVHLTFTSGRPADFVNVNWFSFGHRGHRGPA